MREVDRKTFYDALKTDQRDIMPKIVGSWDRELGYKSVWNDRIGNVFGESQGKAQNQRYWMKESE